MQRREFLQATAGSISAAIPQITRGLPSSRDDSNPPWLSMYDETLAASTDLELLGIPRSWWFVHHGLHPFSPERVIILPTQPHDHGEEELRKRIFIDITSKPNIYAWDDEVSTYLVHMACKLAQVYRIPEHAEEWAHLAVALHMMGANYFHQGLGLVLNLQPFFNPENPLRNRVPVKNGLVDWWLVLIPHGIQTSRVCDPEQTYALIIPVYSAGKTRDYLRFCHLLGDFLRYVTRTYGDPQQTLWSKVAAMNRKEACLFLNRQIGEVLYQRSAGKVGVSTSVPKILRQS